MTVNIKHWLGSDAVEVFIRLAIVTTLIISVISYVEAYNLSSCQANYNQSYAQYALAARITKAEDDQVMRQLLVSIRDARKAPNIALAQKAVDDAFNTYFATTAENEKYRAAHPAPPLPDQYCG